MEWGPELEKKHDKGGEVEKHMACQIMQHFIWAPICTYYFLCKALNEG